MLRRVVLGVLGVVLLLQLVPYGWSHPNPPVRKDAPWPTERAASLARAACYDCHSNETKWPIYSWAAPASWLIRKDVEDGRDELNFSEWDVRQRELRKAAKLLEENEMPPSRYRLAHPEARLSDTDKATLVAALRDLEGEGGGSGRGRGRGRGGDDS